MKTKKPSLRFCTCHLSDALYQIDCVILCEISIIKYHFSYLEYGMSRKIVEDYLCTLHIFMEKDSMEASGRRRSETYKCQQLFVFASNDERTLCFGKQMMYLYGKTTFFFRQNLNLLTLLVRLSNVCSVNICMLCMAEQPQLSHIKALVCTLN